jgi:hypothetical protein
MIGNGNYYSKSTVVPQYLLTSFSCCHVTYLHLTPYLFAPSSFLFLFFFFFCGLFLNLLHFTSIVLFNLWVSHLLLECSTLYLFSISESHRSNFSSWMLQRTWGTHRRIIAISKGRRWVWVGDGHGQVHDGTPEEDEPSYYAAARSHFSPSPPLLLHWNLSSRASQKTELELELKLGQEFTLVEPSRYELNIQYQSRVELELMNILHEPSLDNHYCPNWARIHA